MAYGCAGRKNREGGVAGTLRVINVYDEHWGGLSLPRKQFRIEDLEKRFKRALAERE